MRKINLNYLMNNLYETNDYFVKILPDGSVGYEEEYHSITIDPDGNKRNLLEEKSTYLKGVIEITSYLNNLTGGKILDIGCGLGWILSSLDNKWDKYGIEISKFASKHASQFGKIHNGTLDNYEFNNVKYDAIIMNHVIEHLSNPLEAIQKIHNILTDNSIFIIGTPNFDSGAARKYGDKFRLLHDQTHISLFSSDSMHRFLRDNGFQIIKVEYPFFDTPWFNKKNLLDLLDNNEVSPPFYGSIMTFFCKKITN